MGLSTHLSQLPACSCNVTPCLVLPPPRLLARMGFSPSNISFLKFLLPDGMSQ